MSTVANRRYARSGTPGAQKRRSKRERILTTPEGLNLPITVASKGARAGAMTLDLIIIMLAIWLMNLVVGAIASGVNEVGVVNTETSSAREFLGIVNRILMFGIWYGYFLIQELGPRGATFGKRAARIRVAARDGGHLTPEAVIARNLLRDVEIFYPLLTIVITLVATSILGNLGLTIWVAIVWFLVFLLFPFFNKDALRAGDLIAGTWVVEAPRAQLAEALSTQGAAAQGESDLTGARYEFGDEELAIYGEHELQTLERVLREDQAEAMVAVHEAICTKIGWAPGAGDERAFLEAFYSQLRAKLEGDMRFGVRKADKYS